jgi:phenylpropionate dioxygenase-like ring-hydroxylating dioxygenase large terminal subunit
MTYLMNAWYVAGWANELVANKLLSRRFLEQAIVLFRDSHGIPHALADRCPHRFAPLSMGKLCDGGAAIQCPYHGLRFGPDGACVLNPHGGGAIPKAATVRSYPLVERESALWIWMGEQARADESLIPHFDFMDTGAWAVGTDRMMIEANYELEIDNILDLSHIEFMHPLFASEAVRRGKTECSQDGDTVWSRRFITGDDLPEFLKQAFQIPAGQLADRWLDVRWNAPAQMALWSGAVLSGRPRDEGINVPSAHMFTPESGSRTHYFFSVSFPLSMGAVAYSIAMDTIKSLRGPFENEDKPIIEGVAANMSNPDLLALDPVLLSGDAAAVRARRLLKKRIGEEGIGK